MKYVLVSGGSLTTFLLCVQEGVFLGRWLKICYFAGVISGIGKGVIGNFSPFFYYKPDTKYSLVLNSLLDWPSVEDHWT